MALIQCDVQRSPRSIRRRATCVPFSFCWVTPRWIAQCDILVLNLKTPWQSRNLLKSNLNGPFNEDGRLLPLAGIPKCCPWLVSQNAAVAARIADVGTVTQHWYGNDSGCAGQNGQSVSLHRCRFLEKLRYDNKKYLLALHCGIPLGTSISPIPLENDLNIARQPG